MPARSYFHYLLFAFFFLALCSESASAEFPTLNGCTPSQATFRSSDPADDFGKNNPISAISTITVNGLPDQILDIDVSVELTHPRSGDVLLTLSHPGSTNVTLTSKNGGTTANLFQKITFDDQADRPLREVVFEGASPQSLVTPEEPLDSFFGLAPNGTWTLQAFDVDGLATGTLQAWEIRVTTCDPTRMSIGGVGQNFPPPGVPIQDDGVSVTRRDLTVQPSPEASNGTLCGVELRTGLSHPDFEDLTITLTSPRGTVATVTDTNRIHEANGLNAIWRSTADLPVTDAFSPGLTRTALSPEESFAIFYGEHAAGTWTLALRDNRPNGKSGSLSAFSLQFAICGFEPIFENQSLPAIQETAPIGSVVGTLAAQEVFNFGKFDTSGPVQTNRSDGLIFSTFAHTTIRAVTVFPTTPGDGSVGIARFVLASSQDPFLTRTFSTANNASDIRLKVPLAASLPPRPLLSDRYIIFAALPGPRFRNTGVRFDDFERPGVIDLAIGSSLVSGSYGGPYNWEIAGPPTTSTFSIDSGDPDGAFAIDPGTGEIRVADTSKIDFESKTSFDLAVSLSTSDGFSKTRTVTIPILDSPNPEIVCPRDVSVVNGDSITPNSIGAASAGPLTTTFKDAISEPGCPQARVLTRTWSVTDGTGNTSTCNQKITMSFNNVEDLNGNGILECDAERGTTDQSGQCVPGAGDCFYEPLKKSACVGANGFLGQINIASVINLQASDLDVTVQYFNDAGLLQDQVKTTIASNLKSDFIINDLGLQLNTIGTVCVVTNAGAEGAWTGGLAVYKPNTRNGTPAFGESFDFALYYPFLNPLQGTTTTPLNTFHLGTSSDALVANWISIIDASRGDGKGVQGEIKVFDPLGQLTRTLAVSIPDGGRADFPGHEALSGVENVDSVGLAQFSSSGASSYYMTLTRYFYDCPGASCTNFLTAFTIPRRPGSSQSVSGAVSVNPGEFAVIELNNITVSAASADVDVFSESGASAGSVGVQVPPLGTTHVIVNNNGTSGFLAENEIGSAKVDASVGSLSALSIFYKLNEGVLESAYAAPLVESPGPLQLSQFNTFIGHQNRTELFNASSKQQTATIDFFDFQGVRVYTETVTLKPSESRRLTSLLLPSDSYGTFTVQSSDTGIVVRNYVARAGEYTLPFLGE
ncbi:MAG: proprotein convertase P-domain-containing protein [Bdellovibrionales bacterium]|nr:proprotein convertase P-domain-containing protein [Bdellovibrionales bacterium]